MELQQRYGRRYFWRDQNYTNFICAANLGLFPPSGKLLLNSFKAGLIFSRTEYKSWFLKIDRPAIYKGTNCSKALLCRTLTIKTVYWAAIKEYNMIYWMLLQILIRVRPTGNDIFPVTGVVFRSKSQSIIN